jgi:hypothetical protein
MSSVCPRSPLASSRDRILPGFSSKGRLIMPTNEHLEKLAEYDVLTPDITFTVEVFRDEDATEFMARIDGHSPPLAQQVEPGEPGPMMKFIDTEELRDVDHELLIRRSKKRMADLGGEIIHFLQYPVTNPNSP